MTILCDVCKCDCTPEDMDMEELGKDFEIVDLNSKMLLCPDCYMALGEFVRSKEFLKIAEKYKKQKAEEMF